MLETFSKILAIAVSFFFLFLACCFLAYFVRVCAADARRRGKSPLFVVIACVLFFPWGTVAWLLFRPDPLDSDGPRPPFHLENHRLQ